MTYQLTRVLCLSLLILGTQVLNAADAGEESASDTSNSQGTQRSEQDSAADTQANASGSEKRRAGDKGGLFLPSEDISEDVAITFPVDI